MRTAVQSSSHKMKYAFTAESVSITHRVYAMAGPRIITLKSLILGLGPATEGHGIRKNDCRHKTHKNTPNGRGEKSTVKGTR
jgi:hypothetical protein